MKKIFIILFISKSFLFACCWCSIVDSAMNGISSVMQSGMESAENIHSQTYDELILKRVKESLVQTKKRLTDLNNTIQINLKLQGNCENEIFFELEKTNNIMSILKSQNIYDNISMNK